VKYRPDDGELLDAIAGLLEDDVLAAVPAPLQHRVRVAANLARILQRGAALEPAARERERAHLAGLLGRDGPVPELRAELDRRIGELDERAVWAALVAIARDDLAVSKPGYDGWEGE
jgi:hypothetical protein